MDAAWGGEGEISEVSTPDAGRLILKWESGVPSVIETEGTLRCDLMSVRGIEAPDEKARVSSGWSVRMCIGKQHRYSGDLEFVHASDQVTVEESFVFATGKMSVGTSRDNRFDIAVVKEVGYPAHVHTNRAFDFVNDPAPATFFNA